MQEVGLIFVSNVRSEDVGIFNSLLDLSNAQINMLSIQTPSDVDSTSIEIYSNGRDDDSEGDFIGGSFLSVVSLDSESPQSSEIMEIFNTLDVNPIVIKELSPNNYFIMIEPGTGISDETKSRIVSLVKNTSTREDVVQSIDDIVIQLKTDETNKPDVNGITPVINKPMVANTPNPPKPSTPEVTDDLVKTVYDRVLEKLVDSSSEINANVLEIGKNMSEITSRIVEIVLREVRGNLNGTIPQAAKIEETKDVNPTPAPNQTDSTEKFATITPADASLESVITEIEKGVEPIKETPETTIYNDKVTLKSLYEGGCESDEELFRLVLENKDKLSTDDLESACYFNMYKYYNQSIKEDCSTRESMIRKIQVGI